MLMICSEESLDPLYSPMVNEVIKRPAPALNSSRRLSESYDIGSAAVIAV
jgi:hypothetical protein